MKRFLSVLICFCFCFSIFVGNIKRTEAAVIDASALFLANSALTYAEASGMNALVSGMTAAEVGTAFSASTVSGYAASVGTTEAALATTVGAGIVITPKTILITAAAAAVLAGIVAYCISQNAELEEVNTPVVLTSQGFFKDAFGNRYSVIIPSSVTIDPHGYLFFYLDESIDYSSVFYYDLSEDNVYSYPSGYYLHIFSPSWDTKKQHRYIGFSNSSETTPSYSVGITLFYGTPNGTPAKPYPYVTFTVYNSKIYFVRPILSNETGYISTKYGYQLVPEANNQFTELIMNAFGYSSSSSSVPSGNSSLSLSRSSSYELPIVGETDSVLITIPENSSVTLDPSASADTILNPIVEGILSETIADRPELTAEVISEPQIEEPDIPENIETPFLPNIVPPWHYVVQLIEDSSDFISVWFQTINSVLPDSLSNTIWAAVVLLVTFGIVRRFLE